MNDPVRIGTRGSQLALAQAREVAERLHAAGVTQRLELVVIQSDGDAGHFVGPGVFTSALERAVVEGKVDCAVHSLKDIPVQIAEGTCIAACLPRAAPGDVLISHTAKALDEPVLSVGTSSKRRTAELRRCRPHWRFEPLRGNVDTRINTLRDTTQNLEAIVLARAALDRGGFPLRGLYIADLPTEMILPAPAQGCVAVQCLAAHAELQQLLMKADDLPTRECVELERMFLDGLGGGCAEPFGCLAQIREGCYLIQARWHRQDGVCFEIKLQASNFAQARELVMKQAALWRKEQKRPDAGS